ncbi:MAG: hypothetical protein HY040_13570 [Planctomycetes bacterium]|nr:hypothetical protein [Planctomycetota bacterium]
MDRKPRLLSPFFTAVAVVVGFVVLIPVVVLLAVAIYIRALVASLLEGVGFLLRKKPAERAVSGLPARLLETTAPGPEAS